MLRHFWNSAVRNLLRHKLFTSINVIGLSLSFAVFLALGSYVAYHFSFDQFFEGYERVYRIDYSEFSGGEPVLQSARSHDRTTLLAHEYVPELEAITRFYNEKAYVFTEDVRMVDQETVFVDSSFMKVFPIRLVMGSDQALTAPKSVVVSQSQARIYFGDENPIGKTLFFNERLPFIVTGVFEDIPENSSLDFDFLLSWSTLSFYGWVPREGSFEYPWTFTFVKVREHVTDIESINTNLTQLANEHNFTLQKRNHTAKQVLRPYADLHFSSGLSGEIKPGVNRVVLYGLLSLALFILIAAWINYVNLAVAQSLERADEIGVRKVFGASRWLISGQFLMEALLLSVVTFVAGVALFKLITGPFANRIFLDITFSHVPAWSWVGYFVAFVMSTTLLAFYPANLISKFKPVLILKNRFGSGRGNANVLLQSLIVFQLFLAVAMVGITLVASSQMKFLQTYDSGFNAAQTITLRAPASTNSDSLRYSRYRAFRSEVLQRAGFQSGTASMNVPGEEIRFHDEGVHAVGSNNDKKQSFWVMWIDEGFEDTFGLTRMGGRNLNQQEDGLVCMVNESAALALGYSNPADAVNTNIINSEKQTVTIVGVWKDYHHESLRKPVEPVIYYHHHPHEYGYYSFRTESREGQYLDGLKSIWVKHYPNDTFTFYFMDRFFEAQYRSDQLFTRLLELFSVLAIVVACLGLFGIATLSMVKRMREIGVRKVLGASIWSILVLLATRYVRLILLGCLFAFPLAYYLTKRWLDGFAYQVAIQWWMIVLPGVIVLVATLVTISMQSIRAATTNPAKVLRDH